MRPDEMFGEQVDLSGEIDNAMDDVELMGCPEESPEYMGKVFGMLFKRLGRRIAARVRRKGGLIGKIARKIRARRKARKAKKRGYGIALETPEGTTRFSPEGGLTYEDKIAMEKAGLLAPKKAGIAGIMETIQKTPMLLAIPASLIFMLLMKRK